MCITAVELVGLNENFLDLFKNGQFSRDGIQPYENELFRSEVQQVAAENKPRFSGDELSERSLLYPFQHPPSEIQRREKAR
jgi:hypothetical protein